MWCIRSCLTPLMFVRTPSGWKRILNLSVFFAAGSLMNRSFPETVMKHSVIAKKTRPSEANDASFSNFLIFHFF